jgi:glyoxylase-like metal-dependent hydrolase (beta-lactamase superfamily II)
MSSRSAGCTARKASILARPTRESTLAEPYAMDEAFDVLPPLPYASTTYCPKAAPATRVLEDGDVVDLGDRVLEVIHTPGHSPGGIALFEAGHRYPVLGRHRL